MKCKAGKITPTFELSESISYKIQLKHIQSSAKRGDPGLVKFVHARCCKMSLYPVASAQVVSLFSPEEERGGHNAMSLLEILRKPEWFCVCRAAKQFVDSAKCPAFFILRGEGGVREMICAEFAVFRQRTCFQGTRTGWLSKI